MNDRVDFYRDKVAKQREENSAFEATVSQRAATPAEAPVSETEAAIAEAIKAAQDNAISWQDIAMLGKNAVAQTLGIVGDLGDIVPGAQHSLAASFPNSEEIAAKIGGDPTHNSWIVSSLLSPTPGEVVVGGKAVIAGGVALLDETAELTVSALRGSKAIGGSRKAGIANMKKAEALYKKGKLSRDEIWAETGWWKGETDGKLRFVISDADAALKEEYIAQRALNEFTEDVARVGEPVTLNLKFGEAFDHPALFELYPQMRDYPISVRVVRDQEGAFSLAKEVGESSFFDTRTKEMGIRGWDHRSSVLHEASHGIEQLEGFTGGTSPEVFEEIGYRYLQWDLMAEALENPERYRDMGVDLSQIRTALKEANPSLQGKHLESLAASVHKGIYNTDKFSAMADVARKQREFEANKLLFWTEQVDPSYSLDEMSIHAIRALAEERYLRAGGEAEARLVQALRDVPQDKLDNLIKDPESLMKYLDPQTTKKLNGGLPEIKPMRENIQKEAAIGGTGQAD